MTGGARRVGAAICRKLAGQGMRIAIHYSNSEADARGLSMELPGSTCFKADFLDAEQLQALIPLVVEHFGRIDVLVNNASLYERDPDTGPTLQTIQQMTMVNLDAPLFLSFAAMRQMALQGQGGRIINIGDVLTQMPPKGFGAYTATRAAVIGLTKTLAVHGADMGIAANAVILGTVMLSHKDAGMEDAILRKVPAHAIPGPATPAEAVAFFVNAPPFITGAVLHVDGGRQLV